MVQNFHSTNNHVCLVVLYTPLLTERLHKLVELGNVVPRHHREQMVVHLILKTSTEPINEPLWNSMSSSDVTCGCYLKLPEVRSCGSIVDRHAVVTKSKYKCKEETRGAGGSKEVHERVGN